MFIKTTTHKRIVAEKDAEIAGLMKRLGKAREYLDLNHAESVKLTRKVWSLEDEVDSLRARLDPFTKIRNRDSRGRFIKDTVA